MKIKCPKCRRVLGEASQSLHAQINCKNCKTGVDIRIIFAQTTDYFKLKKGEAK